MWPWIFISIMTPALLVWAWLTLAPMRARSLRHRLEIEDAREGDVLPPVAILCPGRNEADLLGETLPALAMQDYPAFSVVFVDDDSDDQTPNLTAGLIREHPRLHVLRNDTSPPAGWVGKCWAINRGYEYLKQLEQRGDLPLAEYVCFTDADIHWHPACLRAAMQHALAHDADVVALFPKLTFGSTLERVTQAILVLALGIFFPFERAMDPKYPQSAIAGGAFILVRRSRYEQIGGHHAVKDRVVEDINLARQLKQVGAKFRLAATGSLLWCRMYDGPADLWEGLTKNAYAGLEYRLGFLLGLTVATLWFNVLVPVYLVTALVWLITAPGGLALAAVVMAGLTLLAHVRAMGTVCRLLDLPWYYRLALPVGSAIYLVMTLASAWRYYRGGNRWKGRAYGPTG